MNRALLSIALLGLAMWFVPVGSQGQSQSGDSPAPSAVTTQAGSRIPSWAVTATKSEIELAAETRIKQALARPLDVPLHDVPLHDVVDFLSARGLPASLDKQALEDSGIAPDVLCKLAPAEIQLGSALRQALRAHDLTWMIASEILLITTHDRAESMLKTRLYNVSELIALKARRSAVRSLGRKPSVVSPDFDYLLRAIKETIAPDSWDDVGGPGSVSPLAVNGQLVLAVSQTDEVHDQVEGLLLNLHRITATPLPDASVGTAAAAQLEIPSTRLKSGRSSRSVATR